MGLGMGSDEEPTRSSLWRHDAVRSITLSNEARGKEAATDMIEGGPLRTSCVARRKISAEPREITEELMAIYMALDPHTMQDRMKPKAYTQTQNAVQETWLDHTKKERARLAEKTPNHRPDSGLWVLETLFTVEANRLAALELLIKWAQWFASICDGYKPPELESAATRPGNWLLTGFRQNEMPQGPRHHATVFKKTHTPFRDEFASYIRNSIDAVARGKPVEQMWMVLVGLATLPGVIPKTLALENSAEQINKLFSGHYNPATGKVSDPHCMELFSHSMQNGLWSTTTTVLSQVDICIVGHLHQAPQIQLATAFHTQRHESLLANVYRYNTLEKATPAGMVA